MRKKGFLIAGILAILFVPGAIPTAIGVKAAKLKKKSSLQKQKKEDKS